MNLLSWSFEWKWKWSRLLIAALFIITGLKGLLTDGFKGYVSMISSKGIPFPFYIAAAVLLFKVVAGVGLVLKSTDEKQDRAVIDSLIGFVLVTTVLYHNFLNDSSQLNNALKNLSIVGGLMALRNC